MMIDKAGRIPMWHVCVLCSLLFVAPPSARALEGFKFVAQKTLSAQKPTAILALGKEQGLVAYDEATQELLLLTREFEETGRVALTDASGSRLKGPKCLLLDSARQRILVFDTGRQLLLVFGTDGKWQQTINLALRAPDRLSVPTCMAQDSDGDLYIGDRKQDDIKMFSSDGTYLASMHLPLDVKGRKPRFQVTAITVLRDGTVAAIDSKARHLVLFSREGRFLLERSLDGDYTGMKKLMTLESGELMGADSSQKVYRWTTSGKQTAGLGSQGKERGQFTSLADITCDSDGNLVVLDSKDRDVQVFSFSAPVHVLSGQTRPPEYQIVRTAAEGVAVRLLQLLPDGSVFFDTARKTVILKQKESAVEFRHDELKDVSAACLGATKLYLFDSSREKVFAFRLSDAAFDFAFGEGRLDDVTRILPAPGNTLLFADRDATEVKVFSEDGIFSTSFGKRGEDLPEEIGCLQDMTWHKGQLAILDSARRLVHLFSPNGSFVRNIEIKLPTPKVDLAAIGSDPNGYLLILDKRSSRMLVVDDDGKVMFQFGSQGDRDQDWQAATDFLICPDGSLMLYDMGRSARVLTYRLRTAGPLSQAEFAIADGDWNEAKKGLDPFLSRDFDGTPELVRAMKLALEAHVKSSGKFPPKVQVDQARTALQSFLQKHPEQVEEHLVLAASYREDKRLEDAIAVLRAGQKAKEDPRYAERLDDYAKALTGSGEVKSVVSITGCEAPVILGAVYQSYHDTPVVRLTLANDGGKPTPPGKALFFAKAVMDNPTETELPSLKPFSTATFSLKATFNRNILTYVEDTRLGAQVQVVFGDNEISAEKNLSMQLLGRNSIDWAKEQMIACFITHKDPDVQAFARQALKTAGDQTIQTDLDSNLYKALTLFDAMQSLGLYYVPDPKQPFNFSELSKGGKIDYVQFPRETLVRSSGDCDDLSVLYASLLEAGGVSAILVTSPGHIFAAFKLEKGKQSIDALGLSADLVFLYKDDYYVPVETALLGSPFISAWRVAANTIGKYGKENKIGYIDLRDAWKTYQTVSLPPTEREMPLPKTSVLGVLLKRELDALNLRQVEKRLAIFKRWLEREPKNVSLLMLLARSYAEVGIFDQAEEYGERARSLQPNAAEVNQMLGNLAYMQNDYARALRLYEKADKAGHTAAIQINMALAYLKSGQLMASRKAFEEAKKLDAKLVSEYPELGQLLE
jgi:tetratricopeptide (TPR) repeat protein